jgi:hypothetical protein
MSSSLSRRFYTLPEMPPKPTITDFDTDDKAGTQQLTKRKKPLARKPPVVKIELTLSDSIFTQNPPPLPSTSRLSYDLTLRRNSTSHHPLVSTSSSSSQHWQNLTSSNKSFSIAPFTSRHAVTSSTPQHTPSHSLTPILTPGLSLTRTAQRTLNATIGPFATSTTTVFSSTSTKTSRSQSTSSMKKSAGVKQTPQGRLSAVIVLASLIWVTL